MLVTNVTMCPRVAGGHQVYPRVEHRGRQADHRDAHREVQTRHEDARGPGVCTLRGLYAFRFI